MSRARPIRPRNWLAVAAHLRSGAGKHTNKARRGTGKGSGKAARHNKHKGRNDND